MTGATIGARGYSPHAVTGDDRKRALRSVERLVTAARDRI
jgi:hypothetical protein